MCDLFLCELLVCTACGVIGAHAVVTRLRATGEAESAALLPLQPPWPFTAMRQSVGVLQWVQEWTLGAFAFGVARVGLQMRCAFQRLSLLFLSPSLSLSLSRCASNFAHCPLYHPPP